MSIGAEKTMAAPHTTADDAQTMTFLLEIT